MSVSERSPVRKVCPEREALMYVLNAVVKEMFGLHNEQLKAILSGDETTELHLQARLREVRDRRALLIERLRNHLANHAC